MSTPNTIVRLATGEALRDSSDKWPITWAQDDSVEKFLEVKLPLWPPMIDKQLPWFVVFS